MFFDVVIQVLNFIVSVIRVELPKITLHLLLFCKCRFVDVSCSCRSFSNLFFLFCLDLSQEIFLIVLKNLLSNFFSFELVIRVELQGSYLEKPSGTSGDLSTLITGSHICNVCFDRGSVCVENKTRATGL